MDVQKFKELKIGDKVRVVARFEDVDDNSNGHWTAHQFPIGEIVTIAADYVEHTSKAEYYRVANVPGCGDWCVTPHDVMEYQELSQEDYSAACNFAPELYHNYLAEMYGDDFNALVCLILKAKNDEEYRAKVDFSDVGTIFHSFKWSHTNEGPNFWNEMDYKYKSVTSEDSVEEEPEETTLFEQQQYEKALSLAPKLINRWEGVMDEDDFEALVDVVIDSETNTALCFCDAELFANAFVWANTAQGEGYWVSMLHKYCNAGEEMEAEWEESNAVEDEYFPPASPVEWDIARAWNKHIQKPTSAVDILQEASNTIGQRAAERDREQERSMKACVEAFNAITKHSLTEEQGWLFMVCLKLARAQGGSYKADDYLDMAAYAALAGECAAWQN